MVEGGIIVRIAQITKYFHPHVGGVESNVLGISKALVKRGHEVLVFTSNIPVTKKEDIISGIEVYRGTSYITLFNDPLFPEILISMLSEDYDLIHLHLPDPFTSVLALVVSLLRNKKLVVTYHADILKDKWYHKPFKLLYLPFQDLVLRRANNIIVTSPNYARESSVLMKFKDKIEVVPNFVDTTRFNPNVDGKGIREEYDLENKKIVLFVGRLVEYKGIIYLIDACALVNEKIGNVFLVIAGNGPLKDTLIKYAEEDDVIFLDINDAELPELYASCDVFVLPSVTRQEAFGVTLLEAMASGKPCITSNISGMPYVVRGCGITVAPMDVKGLKEAILKILNDDKLATNLGRKGRERVEENFTIEKVIEQIEKIFQEENHETIDA